MEPITTYLDLARRTSLAEFERIYPHLFLFKHPKDVSGGRVTPVHVDDAATRPMSVNFDPIPGEARIVVARKNPKNPFPDRLTLGRGPDCDVVIRLAFISKEHAYLFVQQGGKLTLRDNNASNATFHNRRKLDPGGACSVKLGDTVSLGGLAFELMDAARVHALHQLWPLRSRC